MLATLSLALLLAAATAAAPPKAPPQLNVAQFASCLREELGHAHAAAANEADTGAATTDAVPPAAPLDLAAIRRAWDLNAADGLLVYLSLYAGKRLPLLNATVQAPAYARWQLRFEPEARS